MWTLHTVWTLHSTMFIFISKTTALNGAVYVTFTFHYVYIYIFLPAHYPFRPLLYIPLCLYLYAAAWDRTGKEHYFTFHYVYIYISGCFLRYSSIASFTFHYVYIYIWISYILHITTINLYIPLCLYLYQSISFKFNLQINLYIPLCLYLYFMPLFTTHVHHIALHSTMFIFI